MCVCVCVSVCLLCWRDVCVCVCVYVILSAFVFLSMCVNCVFIPALLCTTQIISNIKTPHTHFEQGH